MPFKEKIAVRLSSDVAKREANSAIKAKIIRVTDDGDFLTQLRSFHMASRRRNVFVTRSTSQISRLCRIDPLAGRSYRVGWSFGKKRTFRSMPYACRVYRALACLRANVKKFRAIRGFASTPTSLTLIPGGNRERQQASTNSPNCKIHCEMTKSRSDIRFRSE